MKYEYNKLENSNIISGMYLQMDSRIVTSINRKGFDVNSFNIFSYLMPDTALLRIIECTTQQIEVIGYPSTNLSRFKEFMGTRWLRSRSRVSTKLVFEKFEKQKK